MYVSGEMLDFVVLRYMSATLKFFRVYGGRNIR